jgi:hypothetical protein
MSRPSRCSLHQEEFMFREDRSKPTIRMPGSNSETRGGSVMVALAEHCSEIMNLNS